ncbi:MAG: restriction endonuclease [Ruminococcaceae bacterium]|nr:restriction endonuclease [Oscillospiraceae bacterium]
MNYWTQLSVELANQKNYLDLLFKVYPMSPNIRREIDAAQWRIVQTAFNTQNNNSLVSQLLSLELFPIKDSYVSYLRRDPGAIARNPETINRLAGQLYEMGLDTIYEKCTAPKETNRQIGPLFKRWIAKKTLGAPVFSDPKEFLSYKGNAVLNSSDTEMERFARQYLGYNHNKGLDFVARFNNTYVIGEAKFLTDFGGHQDAQFADAISTITSTLKPNKLSAKVIKIAICDGVLYISSRNKMHMHLREHDDQIILSSLLLREFLYSI